MANPGVGNKFVSVNLNKSYGQQQYHQHHHNNQHHSSSYGSNRNRSGGVGGGMVVLSRPRSSQKAAGPKLSVPPPLNLPSLRKEHERFDSLGSGGGPAGGGIGSGPRPGSSGTGWTKPATIAIQDKEAFGIGGDHTADVTSSNNGIDQGMPVNGVSRGSGNSVYTLPSARSVVPSASVPSRGSPVTEKVTVLRGEDFPSLHATLPATSGPEKKQKDGLNQKQKQVAGEELANERNSSQLSTLVDMRPQLQSRSNINYRLQENGAEIHGWGGSVMPEKDQMREDYFSGPLPLVRLNPRSDWADDERDTGLGLADRGRDNGFSKSEAYWDMDFDFPRPSILPQKPGNNLFDRRGQRDNETGKVSSSEVTKVDSYGHDVRMSSLEGREGTSWRASSPISKDGVGVQEAGNEKNGVGRKPSTLNREVTKENKYIPSPFRDNVHDDAGRRDSWYGQGGRQPWNKMDSFGNRWPESNARERHGSEQYNRYRGDTYQSNSISKSSFSSGGKKLPINDPILNFGRDKRSSSRNDKPYLEDPFIKEFETAGFDGRDPFSGGLVGLVKKKKDVLKQTDFHDPVRESFEAELERVQKMQEEERQRIMEEHERAMDLARREEEERMRVAREQEERQRRLEEERQEAMRRAEEERLEAMRRAEEQRIAREEEKQRILLEEERRKQAAKQKLLELEERIAKRHADEAKCVSTNSYGVTDDKLSGMVAEKDVSKVVDMGDWEDSERMVDRITTSASSDSSGMNRPFEVVSRPHFPGDGASLYLDRGKAVTSWKRDLLENGNSSTFHSQDQGNGHRIPRRDTSIGGRTFLRKEFYGGPGFIPSRVYHKGGVSDTHMDDFSQIKGQRWNMPGEGDHYGRNAEIESEFHDNLSERFDDAGWGHGRSRGSLYPPYHERVYQNPEADGLYSFARSRYPMRQPRVLPPPTNSMLRNSYRAENDCPGPSSFSEGEMQYTHGARNESSVQTRYDSSHQENVRRTVRIDTQQEHADNEVRKLDRNTARCDSQSSLSVSSPPDSPVHLSHDDLDESRDSPILSGSEGKNISVLEQGNECTTLPFEAEKDNMMSGSSVVSTCDEEEWTIQNDQQLQKQEEYDEDEDGYDEEDEVHDGEAEDIDLAQDFDSLHVEEKDSTEMMDNLVLGFNEGVEVGMPNDDFEKSLRKEETNFVIQQISAEEQGFFDGMHTDGPSHQPVDGSAQVSVDNTSSIFQETEKAMQDLEIEPKNAQQTSSELMDHVDGSISFGLSPQPQVPSSSGQTVLSSGPSVLGQPDVPVKLPFGLFSGPSLIPSPVPAIQIGSIQMPLHLHASVGPSITQVRPSQPPLFQFGQLRYTSPISQGILPLAPQSMSFVQPSVPTNFPLNQNVRGHLPSQPGQETSAHNLMGSDILFVSMDNQPGLPRSLDVSHGLSSKEGSSYSTRESSDSTVKLLQGQGELSHINDSNSRSESGFQVEDVSVKNVKALSAEELESQPQTVATSLRSVPKEKAIVTSRVRGVSSGGRGKRYVFAVKNHGSKTSLQDSKNSRQESSGFHRPRRQRTEFRVRGSADRRQSSGLVSSIPYGVDDKSNNSGRGSGEKSVSGRVVVPNRPTKQTFESEGLSLQSASSQEVDSGRKPEKGAGKETLRMNQSISHHGEDVDAPLQSGIVRVFEQPGIVAPSDDDDFIEVRSKRQMLNDRREQREKESKAKSRVSKMPRKLHSTSQSTVASVTSNKVSVSVGGEANSIRTDYVGTDGHGLANGDVSAGNSAPIVSQPLLPIGFPAVKTDVQADLRSQTIKSFQTSSIPVGSGNVKNLASGLMFENKNKVLDNAQTSLGSWGNSRINQQVMALTQNQLDEAMKPAQFDTHSSVGDPSKSVGESSLPSSSILAKDKSFASAVSPINSLLAGEKIQFGAVTSPTILPPSSRVVSHVMGPPGPCRSDIQISLNLSAAENDCSLFFEKEKCADDCAHLVDCEAEAAASAIAVAAINSDEIVGNRLGAGLVSASDSKGFGGADIDGITAGLSADQHLANQSRGEESLSDALPADLSVETPPISLWPPLPSPQNSSGQMISHVPGGPASHFPFYEMNPMLGGPIFAFGPQDESASSQSQPQKSSAPVSGPAGSWQHHSGVDSFYGPPAGFTGPFISPPGGIPGVQGPPHMVVYNHFAPVGQFGQVGLSFMGTTYIPSGKQPDWKHNPAASPMGVSEGDMATLNMVSAQRNATNLPTPIQHLAPGSPLLPMASPLAMFDVSPFQSSPDMSVQARWSHVPASPLQSVSVSTSSQQQAEGQLPSQFSHGKAVDQQLINRFPESQITMPADNTQNFPTATDASVTQLPDELGLVDSSRSINAGTSTQSTVAKSSSAGNFSDASKTDAVHNGSGSNSSSSQSTSSAFKMQPSHQRSTSAQNYSNSSGYNYQRGGGISQKNSSGGEWSHRRVGYQGRNQSLGSEKSFPSKMKQIYVAKQTASGTPMAS